MSTPWVNKHNPKSLKDIVGHKEVIDKLKQYVATFKPGAKPILLLGQPGIGKTTIAHALAHDLDLELLEINASDARNKDAIDTIVGGALKQQSLFFRQKIVLVDEVDGLSGMQDRGGVATLVALIPQARFPLIFTANDQSDKIKPLVKACTVIELQPLDHKDVVARLMHIATEENAAVNEEALSAIARRNAGSLRGALNDMQSLQGTSFSKEEVAQLGDRDARQEIENALQVIFKTTSAQVALPAFDDVDEDVDGLLLWIDENIPREYKTAEDLARAFDALAEADKFFGRIRKWQYYRYYVYIYNLLSAGIALAKEKKYPGMTEYKQTGRILKLWIYNQKNAKKKKIAEILAPQLHTSKKRVYHDTLPFLKAQYKNDKKGLNKFCELYTIDNETAEWFAK